MEGFRFMFYSSQIIMIGRRQTIFSTPYFQFENNFHFLFVYVMNTCDDLLYLPSWHHGKQCQMSWKSHGILVLDVRGCDKTVVI